jgi:hypothetical protein
MDYDEQFLITCFGKMESHFGRLTCRLVRRAERPLGWSAYVPSRRGVSRILHLLTTDRDAGAVLGDLVAHARMQQTAVLTGRHEPHLALPLQRRLPVLGFARRPIIRCHRPGIVAALASSRSLLTQIDGEWFVT